MKARYFHDSALSFSIDSDNAPVTAEEIMQGLRRKVAELEALATLGDTEAILNAFEDMGTYDRKTGVKWAR
jgi:hypothetical protein